MKKIFAALLAVLFITGAVLGCGKTPQTELNQAKQQAAEQVAKTAKSGLAQLQGKQAQFKVEEGRAYTGKAEVEKRKLQNAFSHRQMQDDET